MEGFAHGLEQAHALLSSPDAIDAIDEKSLLHAFANACRQLAQDAVDEEKRQLFLDEFHTWNLIHALLLADYGTIPHQNQQPAAVVSGTDRELINAHVQTDPQMRRFLVLFLS